MEFFRRNWMIVGQQLSKLSPSQKWVIGLCMIILLLTGFMFVTMAGRPELVSISSFSSANQGQVAATLQAAGISVQTKNGQLMVPADQQIEAVSILERGNMLAADTSAAFDEFVRNQNNWQASDQRTSNFLVAKQSVLNAVIRRMNGVRDANVIVDNPQPKGFGRGRTQPSAQITVWMQGGNRVSKDLAYSIAGIVSGAVATLQPRQIKVIDANTNKLIAIRDSSDYASGDQLAIMQQREQYYRDKIVDLLGSQVPGVLVAVNVVTDDIAARSVSITQLEETEPLVSQSSMDSERRQLQDAGEPGVNSNAGLSIAGSSSGGTVETIIETDDTFGTKQPVRQERIQHIGGVTKLINATIAVPRTYLVTLFLRANPDVTEEPDDAALEPIKTAELQRITDQVQPLIETGAAADNTVSVGQVVASMYDDTVSAAMSLGTSGGGGGGVGAMLSSAWVKPLGLGALVLVSLGLMMSMVRKATQQPPMPTAEELAGLPPILPTDEELIGEADDSTPSMAGIELNEEELRTRKIAEEIGEMVNSNPTEVAAMLGRWARVEE